ncbi:[NiFe]-hydrogenase assembly chaperone HybE [Thiomicrospira microaerophila]|uniref:[NiFe]-hydrogenase assembly chaperone HybE n=1 Tax=Thiomicrospira microaerophila TaxID=406020 RepID=UPI00200D4065|nr:[NiFe]-hydrogenase assembly chaperone HybE [Thiomicrospira microaerophila]UQB42256.1 [NiFe]-hydrogenase assembly chaperone HybE [Thiomicrospira microaerophila]
MNALTEQNGFIISNLEAALLPERIIEAFNQVYCDDFSDAFMGVNHRLNTEIRGWKVQQNWAKGGLLTPWMLAIVYFPLNQTALNGLTLPEEWKAAACAEQAYQVIGPLMPLMIEEKAYATHLNFHPQLGHYWLQPLVQNMARYDDNQAAFGAWNQVVEFRKDVRAQKQAEEAAKAVQTENPETTEQQEAVSRRAVLAKWFTPKTET